MVYKTRCLDTNYALKKYEDYKNRWVKEHISGEDMCATKRFYENDSEAEGMTFCEYIEEFGFIDGSCYVSFREFIQNEFPLYELADDVEQAICERKSEYDYSVNKRLNWIYADISVDAIISLLENNPASLLEYFQDELAAINTEDKWIEIAEKCIEKIHMVCSLS